MTSLSSAFSIACSYSRAMVLSVCLSSSVILCEASFATKPSMSSLTSNTSSISLIEMLATYAPRLGSTLTSPSSASLLMASLIGVLLTFIFSDRSISISLVWETISPVRILCFSSRYTRSFSGFCTLSCMSVINPPLCYLPVSVSHALSDASFTASSVKAASPLPALSRSL